LPDNVRAYQTLSCNYEALTEEIKGDKLSAFFIEFKKIVCHQSFLYNFSNSFLKLDLFKSTGEIFECQNGLAYKRRLSKYIPITFNEISSRRKS